MPANIKATSMGLLINEEYTLGDHMEMYNILDEEQDFAARLKWAISEKFMELCQAQVDSFNTASGVGRPDLVVAYIHQMQLCTTLLVTLYPQYRRAIEDARNA